jgi:hypothetical protein
MMLEMVGDRDKPSFSKNTSSNKRICEKRKYL